MSLLSGIFRRRIPATFDSVTFDVSRYKFQGVLGGARVWFLPEGGGVGIYFFPLKPDLPKAASMAQLREYYASMSDARTQNLECRILPIDGVRSIWLVSKTSEEQAQGFAYVGSLTIPFRDFSFVIKIQCHEQGMTGMREAVLVDEAFRKGTGRMEDGRFVPVGWSFDDEQFDERFPRHPLSQVRRELRQIVPTVRIEAKVKNAARFDLPPDDA